MDKIENTIDKLSETTKDPQIKSKLLSLLENKFLLYLSWLQLFGVNYFLFITKGNRSKCGCCIFKRNLKYFFSILE